MSVPKVSVVIATYRREEELAKALYSLSKQTDSDYEVVLVDDNGDEGWNNRVRKVLDTIYNLLTIFLRMVTSCKDTSIFL